MLRDAELAARRYLDLVLDNIAAETEISVGHQPPHPGHVGGARVRRSASIVSEGRLRLAGAAWQQLAAAPPGSDHQLAWARAFVGAARDEAQPRPACGACSTGRSRSTA